jgi:hypothetical protein
LEQKIVALLWHVGPGLTADHLRLALRGEDTWFHAGQRKRIRMRRIVTTSRYFGAAPQVAARHVEAALASLEDSGRVTLTSGRWRETGNVRREAARRAREGQ